eukprot:342137-Rhodomonas_salina.1
MVLFSTMPAIDFLKSSSFASRSSRSMVISASRVRASILSSRSACRIPATSSRFRTNRAFPDCGSLSSACR